jgi:lauroyl/myristoyl acyltransferase
MIARRLRARAVVAASWLACRLPERPLLALADFAGHLWYRLAPERRRRARRNLARVTRWLADHDQGSPEARAADRDHRAHTCLVRDAFRH